ncbi:hypothetical protein CDAR_620111 [Caerostris darwini]|uniref:Uncharacterized protein n=1 Tax=Caerostris darwini TaxID=1538125 RepID=A0AAV4TPK9_9ARAC|nr:hypothetical protein CDAR_620111 [Caerostris darwini]
MLGRWMAMKERHCESPEGSHKVNTLAIQDIVVTDTGFRNYHLTSESSEDNSAANKYDPKPFSTLFALIFDMSMIIFLIDKPYVPLNSHRTRNQNTFKQPIRGGRVAVSHETLKSFTRLLD